jgi:hypothetical protein
MAGVPLLIYLDASKGVFVYRISKYFWAKKFRLKELANGRPQTSVPKVRIWAGFRPISAQVDRLWVRSRFRPPTIPKLGYKFAEYPERRTKNVRLRKFGYADARALPQLVASFFVRLVNLRHLKHFRSSEIGNHRA